jgi:predicted NBD/HSP70 family sugar kinase
LGLRGTNQEFGRPYNRRIVLEAIRRDAPTTRTRIAEQVGLTIQTVSTIIRELEEQGFVLSGRDEPRGRGLPPSQLRINPEGGYAIGLHITPVGLDAALINLSGDIVASRHRDAPAVTPDEAFTLIRQLVTELRAERVGGRMLGVGLALPGPFGVDAMSFVGPTTMTGWDNVQLSERLADATGLPAVYENVVAAAALGEQLYGHGAGRNDYYYLFLGVGLGGALMHDGAPLRGTWGNAGELGHIPLVPDGELCPCGNRGCLERYISLEAHARRPAGMSDSQWVDSVAPLFRSALVTIENLFDPETIVLGGVAPRALLEGLAAAAEDLPVSVAARRDRQAPRLIISAEGQQSVLRGAAALAVADALSPRFGQLFSPQRDRQNRPLLSHKGLAA